jgi:hypothetical protein
MRTTRILFLQPDPLLSIIIFQLIWHSSWLHFLLSHSVVEAEEEEEVAEHSLLLLQCTIIFPLIWHSNWLLCLLHSLVEGLLFHLFLILPLLLLLFLHHLFQLLIGLLLCLINLYVCWTVSTVYR